MSTPTEENTPSIGEVLYDQFQKLWPTTPATWNYLSDPVQEIYEKCASAVIDHFKSSTVKQADPWKLPEPPAGMKWHREDGWTQEMLPDGWRPLLHGEKCKAGDEWVSCTSSGLPKWTPAALDHISFPSSHSRTRRPLPQPADPVGVKAELCGMLERMEVSTAESEARLENSKQIIERLRNMSWGDQINEVLKLTSERDQAIEGAKHWESEFGKADCERDQLRKEVEGLKEKLSAAQVDKELLKDLQQSIGDYSNRTAMEISRSVQTEKEYRVVKGELDTALAKLASFQWKPVPVGGITRTDPENKLSLWISKETSETGLEWVHGISNRATHYVHVETLRELLIIPPVPAETETEEQKMRREFEEWVDRENVMLVLSKLEHSGCYTSTNTQSAWAAWQAALASRKDKPQTTEEV